MAKKSLTTVDPTPVAAPRDDLQNLYFHLEHCDHGNKYMAWYGQCRAQGMDHDSAIEDTISHYHIRSTPWYQLRINSSKEGS